MKRLFPLALLLLLVAACSSGGRTNRQRLAQVDTLLNHELADSALHEIDRMDADQMAAADRAYYQLLRAEARWKAYLPVESDSLLDFSLAYFQKHGPQELLARTYYYRGVTQQELGYTASAVESLKQADLEAEKTGDLLLKSKVSHALEDVNFQAGEYAVALRYAQQAVDYSRQLGNPKLLLENYETLAVAWHHAGQADSALHYFEQCLPLVEHVRREEQAHVLANLGVYYKNMGWPNRAEELLLRSVELEPQGFAYRTLGNISADRREYAKAEAYFQQALPLATRMDTRISTLLDYRELKVRQGDYRAANELASQADQLKDSLSRLRQTEGTAMQQQRFDQRVEQQELRGSWHRAVAVAVVAVVLLLLAASYYAHWMRQTSRRMRADQQAIAENAQAIEDLQREKRRQGDQLHRTEERLERLQRQQESRQTALREQYADQITRGKQLCDALQAGGNIVNWQRQDRAAFEAYCRMTDADFATELDSRHTKATPNQRMFLLLRHLGMADGQIQTAMNMSDKAWQMMRSRMKGG